MPRANFLIVSLLLTACAGGGRGPGEATQTCESGSDGCPCVSGECDEGFACTDDVCVPADPIPDGACGDGIVDPGEACDDGEANADTESCKTNCMRQACGDGFVGPGEGCDDGNDVPDDACTDVCAPATCGDARVEVGEACDDGNADDTDACLSTCAAARCGDGFVQAGVETCDDGNVLDTDACPRSCAPARCGDGYVEAGVEACDDGDADETDSCPSTCMAATCGDGFAWDRVEACDDGNADDTDACVSSCELAACGDGFVQAGVEACDDGNANEADGCLSTCEIGPFCGNGVVEAAELCDPCPESCDDADPCTGDTTVGAAATCDLSCSHADSACFLIDTTTSDNVYVADPDGDGLTADNTLSVGQVDSCTSIVVGAFPRTVPVDVVGRNMPDTIAVQFRVYYDPDLVTFSTANYTPFSDGFLNVGFLNLPMDPASWERRSVLGVSSVDNVDGDTITGGVYIGEQGPFFSADSFHPASADEPYAADDPDGVVLARLSVRLQAASDGELVTIDLTNDHAPGTYTLRYDAVSGTVETALEEENMGDGILAVNTPCP